MNTRNAGFTLAETVVALALFASASVVFCQSALNARMALDRPADAASHQEHVYTVEQEAFRIADRKALEAGGEIELPLRVRKDSQDLEKAVSDRVVARWSATVLPTRLLDLHQVSLTISFLHAEGMTEDIIRVVNVYRPNWYEPDERKALLEAKQQEWERDRYLQP